ncbi:hypothetical protein DITRI_Ditri20bG0024800 [Diplodiscus trichospermus]
MASVVTFRVWPSFVINSEFKPRFQVRSQRLGESNLPELSSNGVSVNEICSVIGEKEKKGYFFDGGNGSLRSRVEKKLVKEMVYEELEVLWDDGYGTNTVKDYLDAAKDMIKPDGGPPRWFCPVECGCPVKDSPVLLFLPGLDGVGMGLILHHKALGKVFEVQCLHIPIHDRTSFEGLVKLVEETVRLEHALRPDSPIYLVGDSFGGCLALAVAAHNPTMDLVVILVNPGDYIIWQITALQPLLPILEAFPDRLHVTIPYLLSLLMGDPLKMAKGFAEIIPKETLVWKLKLLKSASVYANSRLHAVKAEVLVLASDKDNMLPSQEEAERLKNLLPDCIIRRFKDNGHTLLLEDMNLLTVIKGTCKYRQSRRHDFISDFLPPSMSEYRYAFDEVVGLIHFASCSAIFSTMDDGKIVEGLAGVPDVGPVLLVGNHMLMALELSCLIEAFLREKKIMVRGIAHPELFWEKLQSSSNEFSFNDWVKVMGALPVTANHLFKGLSTKSHVLLYPGGAHEALHYKGEEYKLFWPDQPEFVRMAARFGATIVPFGTVGEDDIVELVFDYPDLMKISVANDKIEEAIHGGKKTRDETKREVGNQELFVPGMLPKIPGRFYYPFGKSIKLKGREDLAENRENANELYLQVKSEVERCIAYLLKKREDDPYRSIIDRTIYRAFYAPPDQVPAFKP